MMCRGGLVTQGSPKGTKGTKTELPHGSHGKQIGRQLSRTGQSRKVVSGDGDLMGIWQDLLISFGSLDQDVAKIDCSDHR